MGMGMTAGAVGSFVGNPSELILIRMTADGRLPVAERRNYTGFFNALFRIAREEGRVEKCCGIQCGSLLMRTVFHVT